MHRQHVDGGTGDAAVGDRVGVHGDEQVGMRRVRTLDTLAQLQELVAVARQHRAHSRLGVEARGECARNRERHVLLARATVPDGAGVLAPVPGVHRNDDIALAIARGVNGAHRLRSRDSRRGGGEQRPTEGQHQAPALRAPGAVRRQGTLELHDHAQRAVRLKAYAHVGHDSGRGRHVHATCQMGVRQIDHRAVGVIEREEVLTRRAAQIESQLRGICGGGERNGAQFRGVGHG